MEKLVEAVTFMANALGQLRRLQNDGGLPAEACRILDDVDAFMERNGGDLDDERKP